MKNKLYNRKIYLLNLYVLFKVFILTNILLLLNFFSYLLPFDFFLLTFHVFKLMSDRSYRCLIMLANFFLDSVQIQHKLKNNKFFTFNKKIKKSFTFVIKWYLAHT